jgi:hypothetical protein
LVIDYLESGGNCLTKSSVFIKCSGYKYPGSVKLGFQAWIIPGSIRLALLPIVYAA